MPTTRRDLVAAAAAAATFAGAASAQPASQAAPPRPARNVVLVHGAFADGSGWRGVYDELTSRGYRVSIVQNPLTSLADDAERTRKMVKQQPGPVLLRRARDTGESARPTQLRLADLEMDLLRRRVSRAGQRIELTAKEFQLLMLFMRRQGEVLSRTQLAELVWDMNFDSETNVVEVAIRRLRSKMDVPFAKALLHTVRGMGYVMEDRAP